MAFNGFTAVLSPCFRLSLVFLQPKYQSFPEYRSKSIWRSLSASCLFSELGKARHSNAFVRECLLKNAMITLANLRRPYPSFFGLTEACQSHGLDDFELKLFRLSNIFVPNIQFVALLFTNAHYNKAEVLCIVVMYFCLPLACVGSALIDITIFQKIIIFPIYILYRNVTDLVNFLLITDFWA